MINNLIKKNKSMGTSVFSSQNIAKFGGCIFSQFEVSEDSSLTEEMMRLSFTRFFTRVTTTPNNLGFISIRIPVFLLFTLIEKIVKIIINSHALSRQRNADRILKITVEPPQVHSCISDDVNLI